MNIFENPLVERLATNKLKEIFQEHGFELITISLNENGKIDFSGYKEKMKVIPENDFIELLKQITE